MLKFERLSNIKAYLEIGVQTTMKILLSLL